LFINAQYAFSFQACNVEGIAVTPPSLPKSDDDDIDYYVGSMMPARSLLYGVNHHGSTHNSIRTNGRTAGDFLKRRMGIV
jgi:hypothetical protein